MLDKDKIDFSRVDYGAASPAQWIALEQQAVRCAHAERDKVVRLSLVAVMTPLRRIGAAFAAWRKMCKRRREELAAIAELRGLDDITLSDMGITRCEIATVVRDGKERPCVSPKPAQSKVARAA
jgi:uncharacterized protein YjiS (DUF1127 family)